MMMKDYPAARVLQPLPGRGEHSEGTPAFPAYERAAGLYRRALWVFYAQLGVLLVLRLLLELWR